MGEKKIGVKEKAVKKLKEAKGTLIVSGVIIAGTVVPILIYNSGVKSGYQKGFVHGGAWGFERTIKWFDELDPKLNLKGVWDAYKIANPDKISTVRV